MRRTCWSTSTNSRACQSRKGVSVQHRETRGEKESLPFERHDNRTFEAKEGELDPRELEPSQSFELDYLFRRTFE